LVAHHEVPSFSYGLKERPIDSQPYFKYSCCQMLDYLDERHSMHGDVQYALQHYICVLNVFLPDFLIYLGSESITWIDAILQSRPLGSSWVGCYRSQPLPKSGHCALKLLIIENGLDVGEVQNICAVTRSSNRLPGTNV